MAIAEVGSGTQRATIRVSNGANGAAAYPANVTSGNLLVCCGAVWLTTSNAEIVVTDTRSTSYTTLRCGDGHPYAAGFMQSFVAYGLAASSGACTVTADPTGNAYINAVIDEFSGVHATPLDAENGTFGFGQSTTPTDSLTTLTDGALVIGATCTEGAMTITPGSGYTTMDEDESGDRQPYSVQFKIAGAAGSQTVDWTIGSSTFWRVRSAAFAAAAGGAASVVPVLMSQYQRRRD